MTESEKEEIQTKVLKIANKVKEHGKEREVVKIRLDVTLKGQDAVNYQVLRCFTSDELTDKGLLNLIFMLGQKNAVEILKIKALENGIRV